MQRNIHTLTIYIQRFLFLFFILCLAGTTGFAEKKDKERTDQKTFTVQGAGTFVLRSNIGDVQIVAGKADEVSVQVKIHGSEKKVDKFKTDFKQEGNTVTVKGDFEKSLVDKFKFGLFRSSSLDVKFIVTLPEQYMSDIQTAGGDINIKGLSNKQVGKTSGGDITLEKCAGELWFTTSGGDIELRNTNGKSTLKTSGGGITAHSSIGDLEVETSGGDIIFDDVDGKLAAKTSGGKINVRANTNKGMNLTTSGGDINVKVPSATKGVLDASTFGGEVHCDLPFEAVGKNKKTKLKGNINGGGELILLKTTGGDVKVESF